MHYSCFRSHSLSGLILTVTLAAVAPHAAAQTAAALSPDLRHSVDQIARESLAHTGVPSAFTSENVLFPDDHCAVVVLTNQDAASEIAAKIGPLLFTVAYPANAQKLEQARNIFAGLQRGTIERQWFTDNANDYFSGEALKDFASSLGPLGTPDEFVQVQQQPRGGMMLRAYQVKFARKTLRVWTYEMPDGKLEQYLAAAVE